MKKITCIQQYVIDKLIDDKKISILRYCGIRTSQVIIRLGSVIQKILADL